MNKQLPVRSPALYILLAGMALVIVNQWLRLREAMIYWGLLNELSSQTPPVYLAVSGALWELLFLIAAVSLFFLQSWSIIYARILIGLFIIWYWLDRLFIARSNLRLTSIPFSAGMTLFLLLISFYLLVKVQNRSTIRKVNNELN